MKTKPIIMPNVLAYRLSRRKLLVQTRIDRFIISGAESGDIASILRYCDGMHDIGQISSATSLPQNRVMRLLNQISSMNILDAQRMSREKSNARTGVEGKSVLLIGLSTVGQKLAEEVLLEGVKCLYLCGEADSETAVGTAFEGNAKLLERARTLARSLRIRGYHNVEVGETSDQFRDNLKRSDAVVRVSETRSIAEHLKTNSLCIENGKTFLGLRPNGPTFEVGPLVIPEQQTACYSCYLARRAAAGEVLDKAMYRNKAYDILETTKKYDAKTATFLSSIGCYLLSSSYKERDEPRNLCLVDTSSFIISWRWVLKAPFCEACSR